MRRNKVLKAVVRKRLKIICAVRRGRPRTPPGSQQADGSEDTSHADGLRRKEGAHWQENHRPLPQHFGGINSGAQTVGDRNLQDVTVLFGKAHSLPGSMHGLSAVHRISGLYF